MAESRDAEIAEQQQIGSILPQPPSCQECGSKKVWKDGLRKTKNETVQRFLCRSCGYRFSESKIEVDVSRKPGGMSNSMDELTPSPLRARDLSFEKTLDKPSFSRSEDIGPQLSSPVIPIVGKNLYSLYSNSRNRRVCETITEGSKNLVTVETRTEVGQRGATIDVKSILFQYAWWLKKEGYAESTVTTRVKILKILSKRGADLQNPDSIKETIAHQEWSNKRKINAADAYTAFLRMKGETWNPPRYLVPEKLPFIPTEKELDALIAGCGPKTSTFLQLLKETGMRAGEAHALKWAEIDFETGTVRITPEKGSRPRILKLSNKLLSMLLSLKGKNNTNHVFSKHLRTQRRLFQKQRATLVRKLQNPRLFQIHFHTFRHWKATIEYHKTRDILYVMNLLGHRNIRNTLIYTQLIDLKNDEWISKVARNAEEASQLVEAGFEYVCTAPENIMLFRKRK